MEKDIEIIHIVLGKGNPNRLNGVNKVAYNLATVQVKMGSNVSLFGITSTPENDPGYHYTFNLELFKAQRIPFAVDKKLKKRLFNMKKPCFVHLHGGFIPEFVTISALLKKRGIPFLITSHGAYNIVAMQTNAVVKKVYFPLLEKLIVKRAYAVHLIGISEKEGLSRIAPHKKVVIIPNGQELLDHYPEKQKSQYPKTVLGYLGRIDIKTKGLDIIVQAVKMLSHRERQSVQVKIIGAGNEEGQLKKMIREAGVEQLFRLVGAKYGPHKREEISTFDIFLHPSRNEGMPGAVLEAAAQKIPCIVSVETNVGSYIEKYNAGIVLRNNSPDELKKAIVQLLALHKLGKLDQMGNNAFKMVKEEFSWEKVSGDLLEVYRSAVRK